MFAHKFRYLFKKRPNSPVILFNFSLLDVNPTGVGVYITSLSEEIWPHLESKYRVIVLIPSGVDLAIPAWVKKIELTRALRQSVSGGLAPFLRFFWNQFLLPFYSWNVSLVYCPSTHGSTFIKKQVVTVHDCISLRFPKQHVFQSYYFRFFVPYLLDACSDIITVSESSLKEVVEFYRVDRIKLTAILNGFNSFCDSNARSKNPDFFQKSISEPSINLLVVGATYPHKNIEVVIRALQVLPSTAKLKITGKSTPYLEAVLDLARRLQVEDRVFHLGYIERKQLLALYREGGTLVYPSFCEGFGLPIAEALCAGGRVVASDIPIFRELFDGGVIFFDPEDPKSLCEAVIDMQMKPRNFDPANVLEKFSSWQATAEKVSKLILSRVDDQNNL